MLTSEQTETIKKRLIEQIDSAFPEDRKEFAKNQIEVMSSEELEKFLIKNNLLQVEGGTSQENCVFCAIASGNIKSYKIAENKKALAVLEINPLSRGHVIIIPKEHLASEGELPKQVSALSKRVSSLIKSILKPKEVKIEAANVLGHEIVNIIPIYENQKTQERKHASPEELSELQKILKRRQPRKKTTENRKTIKKIIKKFEEKIWLPKRIP